MDGERLRILLAAIEPSDAIPAPPGMRAIAVAAALDAGADRDELEAWVREQGGWARRMPLQFLPPDSTEREALFVLLPDALLEGPPPVAPVLPGADLVAFVATTSLAAARAFYEQALGLTVTGASPIALTFDANGTALRVVAVERVVVAPYTALGWTVADIEAAVRAMAGRGVRFERFDGIELDELGIWRSPGGARVAWFKDPDGNTLSLTQF